MTRRTRRAAAVLVQGLALVTAGCAAGDQATFERSAGPAPTTSTLPVATTPSCPAVPARADPDPTRPRYALTVDVASGLAAIEGRQQVVFTPDLDTDRLVFRLWPNGPRSAGARLEAGPVTVGGRPAESTLDDPTTLSVRTGSVFRAGRALDVAMTWRLTVPGPANDRVSRSDDSLRLGSFFPILPWEPGVGWSTEPAVAGFAEASSAPTADFDLTVRVPDGLEVLTSGQPDPVRPGRFTGVAMRDLAMSVGRFHTVSAVAMAPDPVRVTVGVQRGLTDSPAAYLERAAAALEDMSRRYGPYPWPTFTMAVTPELGGGIEYPAHVMQGPNTLSVVGHEVGHQWFYALVGNDQGRDPWLDEGLATWADTRFADSLDRLRRQVIPAAARNQVGRPMTFWAERTGDYFEGVYVQGAQAVAALGEPSLVDCALRIYAAVNAHRIARQADLVRAAQAVFPDAAASLAAFGVAPR